jgi:hypothetical protein
MDKTEENERINFKEISEIVLNFVLLVTTFSTFCE